MSDKEQIVCPKCGLTHGEVREIEGHESLIIGQLAINNLRGVCLNCGYEFYWSLSERALARLIKRALDNGAKYR